MKDRFDIKVEATPVIDLSRKGMSDPENFARPGELYGQWDSEKTEVYADADDGEGFYLVDADGEEHQISTFPFVIGRGTECDLVLAGKGISRRHVEVIFQSGRFVVNDLKSLNGVKVNGFKVSRVILEEGDVIKLGDASLTFTQSGASEPAQNEDEGLAGFITDPDLAVDSNEPVASTPAPIDQEGGSWLKTASLIGIAGILGAGGWFAYKNFVAEPNQAELISQVNSQANTQVNTPSPVESGGVTSAPQAPVADPEPMGRSETEEVAVAQPNIEQPDSVAVITESETTQFDSELPPASDSMAVESPKPAEVAGVAPPPSIALDMPPAPEVAEADVKPKAKPKPVAKPKVKKPAPKPKYSSRDQQDATSLLASARSDYVAGKGVVALDQLDNLISQGNIPQSQRDDLQALNNELSSVLSKYQQGKSAADSGDRSTALARWSQFIDAEKQFLGGRSSAYTDQVKAYLVKEYVNEGNALSSSGDVKAAYTAWSKSLRYGDNSAARLAIDNAQSEARVLYRQALRQEYVNVEKAQAMWREVMTMVPKGSEYYSKSEAKLKWYANWKG